MVHILILGRQKYLMSDFYHQKQKIGSRQNLIFVYLNFSRNYLKLILGCGTPNLPMMMENFTDKTNKTLVSLLKQKKTRTASINLENTIKLNQVSRNSKT